MLKNLLVLPDGTELFSGAPGAAILSLELTQLVNAGQELTVCAGMLEATVFAQDALPLTTGQELTLYKVKGQTRTKVGLFILEDAVRKSDHVWVLTGFDRVSRLDKDLTQYLAGLTEWPYSLHRMAEMVCTACGVELTAQELPNGGFSVQKFTADGITGRQILQWVGEASGRFCRANADGQIEFAWYAPAALTAGATSIGPVTVTGSETNVDVAGYPLPTDYDEGALALESGALQLTDDGVGNALLTGAGLLQLPVYQGCLAAAETPVRPIEKVQLRQNSDDVGVVYPDIPEGNTYTVTGNLLLTAADGESLKPIAQSLYAQLQAVSYTSCKLEIPANLQIGAGDILTVTDRRGRVFTTYVMTRRQSGQRDKLESTGTGLRSSSTAVNNRRYEALSGKMLELRTDVDGLQIANREANGKAAELTLTVDGITQRVKAQEEQMTTLTQTADSVKLQITAVQESVGELQEGGVSRVTTKTGYTFDQDGLRIRKSGESMENLLTNEGMYVLRSGRVILKADDSGVEATDVSVRNYLVIGDHARFEDYASGSDTKRTACFWV